MLLRDVALAAALAAALAVGSLVPVFSVPNEPLMWRAIGWSLLMCAAWCTPRAVEAGRASRGFAGRAVARRPAHRPSRERPSNDEVCVPTTGR